MAESNANDQGGSLDEPTYVGHGQRGTVSVRRERCPTTRAERLVATKRRRPSAPAHTIEREAEFLCIANRHGIGPHLLGLADDGESVRYEYVRGLPILDHIQQPSVDKDAVLDILKQVFAQLLCLDRLRLNKHEMTWPAEHILIEAAAAAADCISEETEPSASAGAGCGITRSHSDRRCLWRPVLIDFERCTSDAAKPRNVTQFLQFLATPTVMSLLRSKHIAVDVPRLRRFGSEYKARLATLEAAAGALAPDQGCEDSEGAKWDFIGILGLRDEPRDEPMATERRRGRARRKLEAKRMRADADLRTAGHHGEEEEQEVVRPLAAKICDQ